MIYRPVIPTGGFAGWKFLKRTQSSQIETFSNSSIARRDELYFRDKIRYVSTPEELVSDRRLLKVALGAFGLDEDINNKFFIGKVLKEGTLDGASFANKLSDKRYFALSKSFGFGDISPPRTQLLDFADEIINQYRSRQFEIAVGEVDINMRLAMAAQREISEIAVKSVTPRSKWYSVIASPSLSNVFQVSLGLPESVRALNIDQQVEIYASKSKVVFGSDDPGHFESRENIEALVQRFFLRSESMRASGMSRNAAALALLQGAQQNRINLRL